jgi:hypothetical protein
MQTHPKVSVRAVAAGLVGATLLSFTHTSLADDSAGERNLLAAIHLAVMPPAVLAPTDAKVEASERGPLPASSTVEASRPFFVADRVASAASVVRAFDAVPRSLRELVARRFTIVAILEHAHDEAPLVPSPWARVEIEAWFSPATAPVGDLALSGTGESGGSATGIAIDSNMSWARGAEPNETPVLVFEKSDESQGKPVAMTTPEERR